MTSYFQKNEFLFLMLNEIRLRYQFNSIKQKFKKYFLVYDLKPDCKLSFELNSQ